jgi:hypothetical protein
MIYTGLVLLVSLVLQSWASPVEKKGFTLERYFHSNKYRRTLQQANMYSVLGELMAHILSMR